MDGSDPVELRARVRGYIDSVAIPAEPAAYAEGGLHGPRPEIVAELRAAAREAGVFAPTVPVELGGLGLDHVRQAVVLEEAGRSLLGPVALNCHAPDEGNIVLLNKVGSVAQRERYLEPLARGEIRSSFAMTEPSPGAGSDPRALATTATRTADGWRIDGTKWFITGAEGAAFYVVMARTSESGASMFLVDAGHPGLRLERTIDTLDTLVSGGHGQLEFEGCTVGQNALLGELDQGFAQAQLRLAPARLTHCMRHLGAARRAHEIAARYAADRELFGTTLGELGMAQQQIADNEIAIASSRAFIEQVAALLDTGARGTHESSLAKTFVSEAVFGVVDRSLQLCGAFGVSGDTVISAIYREVRPFRIYDGASEVHRWSIARRVLRGLESGRLPGDVGARTERARG
jgi:alkylation response protein AidB-like acyl-CoA dehydrogenase